MTLAAIKYDISEYAKGKVWYWYVPAWLFGAYIFVKLLSFELGGQRAFLINIPQSFNFMLHEMSHILFGFAPSLVAAAAGSFSELLLGTLLIFGAFKGRTYFASLFCFLWFMLACQSVADYMADARLQKLPLVSLGGELSGSTNVIHDWNFIFGELNLLEADTFIAGVVRTVGVVAGLFGLIFAGWLMYKMAGAVDAKSLDEKEATLLNKTANEAGLHVAPSVRFRNLKKGDLYPTATKGRLSDELVESERGVKKS